MDSAEKEKEENIEKIRMALKYERLNSKKVPVIREIKRISKEGQRAYVKKNEIKKVKNNFGIAVISTSKGVMTGKEAHKMGLGGEYICEVW